MSRVGRFRTLGVALLLAMMLAACGGDDDPSDEATQVTEQASATMSPDDGGNDDDEGDGSSGSGDSPDGCPLSVDQVSEALGTTVEKEETRSSCTFFPPGNASPRAIFVRLSAIACSEEYFEATGQEYEPYDGLGVEAYATLDSSPASILVCTDPPFDINVEIPGDAAASLAAADELAQIALGPD